MCASALTWCFSKPFNLAATFYSIHAVGTVLQPGHVDQPADQHILQAQSKVIWVSTKSLSDVRNNASKRRVTWDPWPGSAVHGTW